MKFVVAAVLVLAATGSASAQPGNYAPLPAAPVHVDQVDESVALGLSLGGTVVSWGLLLGAGYSQNENAESLATIGAIGTMVAPSFGHWYSHKAFTRGMGIRGLGLAAGVIGIGMALDSTFDEGNDDDESAGAVLLLGAALYVIGTVDDIATVTATARAYNSRFRDVNVVPTMTPNGGGVALVGRF